ncbi:MAG: META domain-containing protein [Oceanicaulis sp.]
MSIRTLLACACALPLLAACGGAGDGAGNDTDGDGAERAAPEGSRAAPAPALSDGLLGGPETSETVETGAAPSAFSRAIIPLVARGNEPGWLLEIGEETLSFQYDYGEQSLTADSYAMAEMEGGVRFTVPDSTTPGSPSPGADLRVRVSDERCTAASGMPHPYTVEVRLGERSFTGCGGETSDLLTGASWTVTAINGEPVTGAETPPTIGFTRSDVGGSTGCNTYAATYTLTGETIDIRPGRSTRMACAEDLMAREAQLLAALDGVNRLSLEGDGSLVLEGEVHRIEASRSR